MGHPGEGAHTTNHHSVQGEMEGNHGKTGTRGWKSLGKKRAQLKGDFKESSLEEVASELDLHEVGPGVGLKTEEEISKRMTCDKDTSRRRDCRRDDGISFCPIGTLFMVLSSVVQRCDVLGASSAFPLGQGVLAGKQYDLFTFVCIPSNT